jgi:RNA 2',3'-cyclic 3'-phosphodiesterase
MDAQLSLPGIAPAPRRTERFYFAVLPVPAIQPRLVALGGELSSDWRGEYRATAGHRLHVSLHHLGDHIAAPERYLGQAMDAAARVALPAFDASFDQAMVFSGRAKGAGQFPLVACASQGAREFQQLATALAQVLHEAGLPSDFRKMLPHLTLGYAGFRMPPRGVSAITWRVGDFALVHVRFGLEPRHRVVARWRLIDQPPN